MPKLTGDQIRDIAFHVLRAAGASGNNAHVVADHLANANLAGHDSHGFIRITQYVEDIRNGTIDAKAEPTVAQDHGGLVQIDGNGTFGQVVAARATGLAIERARQNGVATVTMTNLDHTGRIGTYPEMVAVEGMASIMVTGVVGGTSGMNVAPFGGTRRKLGTNPIAIGFPYLPDSPMLLDFATSVSAEGKLRVYRNRGHLLPSAWVIDKDGEPSNDPNDYYEGGSILPLGGMESGHKGYALSVMVDPAGRHRGRARIPPDGHRVRRERVLDNRHRRGQAGAAGGHPGAGQQDDRGDQGHTACKRGRGRTVSGRDGGQHAAGAYGQRCGHRGSDLDPRRGAHRRAWSRRLHRPYWMTPVGRLPSEPR